MASMRRRPATLGERDPEPLTTDSSGPTSPPPWDAPPPGFSTLRELLTAVIKHWPLALAAFVSVFSLAVLVTALQTPLYQAKSLILVKKFAYREDVGERQTLVRRDQEKVINSEIEILRSQDVINGTVERLGAESLYPDAADPNSPSRTLHQAARRFREALSVQALPNTDVIRVAFRHPQPEVAAAAVNILVELFGEKHLEAFSHSGATALLEEKVTHYRSLLEESKQKVQNFEATNERFSLHDSDSFLLRQRDGYDDALRQVERQMAEARQRLLREDPAVTKARAQLLELQLREQRLRASFNDSSKQVADVRKEILLVQEFLAEQAAADEAQLDAELGLLQERRRELTRRIARVDARLQELPELLRRYRELLSERDANQLHYDTHLRRLDEARLSQEMDREKVANLSIIERASVPMRPVSPRRNLNLAVGFFLAVMMAFLVPYIVESLPRLTQGGRVPSL